MTTSQLESEYWDKVYQRREYVYGTAPSQYLLQHAALFQPGMKVFMAGDGEGRNGVWVASQGMQVVSAERSSWGIAKAMRLARRHQVRVTFECCDLLDWEWPQKEFDAAVAMYLHLPPTERKQVHRNLVRCLKPGGFLLLEAFKRRECGEQLSAEHVSGSNDSLFTAALLAQDFCGLQFIELLESAITLDEGRLHQGCAEVVRMLARKLA